MFFPIICFRVTKKTLAMENGNFYFINMLYILYVYKKLYLCLFPYNFHNNCNKGNFQEQ